MAGTYKNYSVGILEAPSDGAPYARKDGDWTQIAGSTPEVFTYDTMAGFPVTGASNTLYVDKSTSKVYFYNAGYVETKTTHNTSSGLQGGTTDEYYHLTEQQRALVLGINGSISSSTLSSITVTDNGDGTVTTGSVLMLLKASTALNAEAHSAVLAGIGPIALTINTKYFLVGDWNGGNPIQRIEAVSATTINDYSIALIGILTRGIGGDIYYTDIGQLQLDANNKVLRRLDDSQGLIIKTSGGIVSSSAGRYLQITAARYFIASNIKYVSALDTTGAGRFSQMHGDSTAGFTEVTGLQQINNTQYWNTTTHTLDNLSSGRFAVRWIFQLIDGPDEVYSFIGTNQYTTLASARSALLTNDLPAQLQQYLAVSVLIAKIIVQQGSANVIEVNNIVNTASQQIATSDHNQLSTLQGGTTDEYYHLTAQRHETLSELADGRFSPVSDSTTAFQVTKADETTSVFSIDTTNSIVGVNGSFNFTNGTANKFIFSGTPTADRTITFPNETGTIALLSQAQSVSWTAGTTAGPTLSVAGGTAVAIPSASATASGAVTTGTQEFAGAKTFTNTIAYKNGTAYNFTFAGTPTANRTITMPDATGTVALLETANVFTSNQIIRANTTESLRIELSGTGVLSTGWIGFYENGGSARLFRIGNTSSGNHNLELIADLSGCDIFHKGAFTVYRNGTSDLNIDAGGFASPLIYSITTASAANVFVNSAGYLLRSTSARKYKTNITNLINIDTSFVYQIEPVKYTSLAEHDDKSKWFLGIVADQVNELEDPMAKLLVNYGADGVEVEGFQYERLTVLLLKEIQNLNARLKVLEEA